jgi:hypothetical protein
VPCALRPDQCQHQNRADYIRADEHGLAAVSIDNDAGDRTKDENRYHLGDDKPSNSHALANELEDEDDHGDVVQRVAEAREQLPKPEWKIARAGDYSAIGERNVRDPAAQACVRWSSSCSMRARIASRTWR